MEQRGREARLQRVQADRGGGETLRTGMLYSAMLDLQDRATPA